MSVLGKEAVERPRDFQGEAEDGSTGRTVLCAQDDPPSPTEVQDWFLCPQFWAWRHVERWRPREVGQNEVSAWIGSAVHAGIARWVLQGTPEWASDILMVAMARFGQEVTEAEALGREVPKTVEKDGQVILPTLRQFVSQAPEWLQTTCRGVEVALGHARLDWIGRPQGEWLVVDFKTKGRKPKERYLEAYQWELRRSWQFAEYLTRAMTHPDSPAYGGVVGLCEVQTIILDPFEVLTDRFIPTQPSEAERRRVFRQMAPDVTPIRRRDKCRNWFGGDCPYLRACWDYEGDPDRMRLEYVQIPSKEAVSVSVS